MNKILIDKMNVKVKEIFIPKVYKDNTFIDEDEVGLIGIIFESKDGYIKLIKDRYSKYSELFVDDELVLNKYKIECSYEEYLELIKNNINIYCSSLTENEREVIYEKYDCSKEQFLANSNNIIEYEI